MGGWLHLCEETRKNIFPTHAVWLIWPITIYLPEPHHCLEQQKMPGPFTSIYTILLIQRRMEKCQRCQFTLVKRAVLKANPFQDVSVNLGCLKELICFSLLEVLSTLGLVREYRGTKMFVTSVEQIKWSKGQGHKKNQTKLRKGTQVKNHSFTLYIWIHLEYQNSPKKQSENQYPLPPKSTSYVQCTSLHCFASQERISRYMYFYVYIYNNTSAIQCQLKTNSSSYNPPCFSECPLTASPICLAAKILSSQARQSAVGVQKGSLRCQRCFLS